MARLWLKVMKNHRIAAQYLAPCAQNEEKDTLVELCKQADLPCPIWLRKHESEYAQFRRTVFLPEHFIEEVSFDRMEIEYLDDSGKKHKSDDPRNQF